MTNKKSLKNALSSSIQAEKTSVQDRFNKAESILGGEDSSKVTAIKTYSQSKKDGANRRSSKVVRDSFSIPQKDYELIAILMDRCLGLSARANKSEIVRAGLHSLTNLSDDEFLSIVESLEKVKTGRPRKS